MMQLSIPVEQRCAERGDNMSKLTFRKLGLSRDEIEAQARAGKKFKERAAQTWIAMHEMAKPDDSEISNFEAMVGKLPQDFRQFLKDYNGGIPSLPLLKTHSNERVIEAFLALKAPKGFSDSIAYAIKIYGTRIPSSTIPIASAGGGDLLLLYIGPGKFGEILYWDHNLESDEDNTSDYFDNTELVASSFSELLGKLAPDIA